MQLECLRRSCDESQSRMNPLKGNHPIASHSQSSAITSQVESNCDATATTGTFIAAYQPSTSTCCASSSTSQLISSISQAIHTVESASPISSPSSSYPISSLANSSSSSSSSSSAPPTTYTITGTNDVKLSEENLPHSEQTLLAHGKNRSLLVSTFSKSDESTDSRDSGINSELSS